MTTEPLVPADCDLRDFPFTPLFRARLFGSSFHARATDAEWRAGVTLWLKSWDQTPAGSLPDDEIDLCRLAELGRDLKAWRKVREGAMRGWVKCDDGRLYHPVVAEGVLEAWSSKRKMSARGKAGADARWSKGNGASNAKANGSSNGASMPQAMLADGNRQGKGQGREEDHPPAQLTDRLLLAGAAACCAAGLDESKSGVDFQPVGRWLAAGADLDLDIVPTIRAIAGRDGYRPPRSLAYFTPAITEAFAQRKAGMPTQGSSRPDEFAAAFDRIRDKGNAA